MKLRQFWLYVKISSLPTFISHMPLQAVLPGKHASEAWQAGKVGDHLKDKKGERERGGGRREKSCWGKYPDPKLVVTSRSRANVSERRSSSGVIKNGPLHCTRLFPNFFPFRLCALRGGPSTHTHTHTHTPTHPGTHQHTHIAYWCSQLWNWSSGSVTCLFNRSTAHARVLKGGGEGGTEEPIELCVCPESGGGGRGSGREWGPE